MKVIDVHAHIVFEETLNFLDKEGPEIGGDDINPWFRVGDYKFCLLYTSPSPRDRQKSRMPSSA